ncbi:protein-lysine N-methyltransferase EEF2KMT isoform X1 [Senna tora]|uniref:Protein-lysine N-methyltransferase EEF2KMT isoform X1 n=1 Tax=Senna tora TaxID=362788 RepID=A0A834W0X7_9FABA|nr:protein-lysine N-methyltransferase EEF2KMT isoform X1 [Senna tora]
MEEEEQRLDHPSLHLLSAVLALEPSESLISYARVCGGGSITEQVQKFIWDHCLSKAASSQLFTTLYADFNAPYLKSFLKKLITEVELERGHALDNLYELYAQYMTSIKDNSLVKSDARICKRISFLFPDGFSELQSCPHSRVLVFPLQCSLNMLEGDTGCSIWPSSLFLSELILSYPELFSNKSCFEIGSGVGLVGICLAHVKASKVILSDGDLSTLANLKFNLELNHLSVEFEMGERNKNLSMVKCMYLPWESASESQLQDIMPDVVLGADVIYDPVCLPHLVRVITILLTDTKSYTCRQNASCGGLSPNTEHEDGDLNDSNRHNCNDGSDSRQKEAPVAYIACVVRNVDTFNCFLSLVEQAKLEIMDLTGSLKPVNLLPYMQSYNQASIRLLRITCIH